MPQTAGKPAVGATGLHPREGERRQRRGAEDIPALILVDNPPARGWPRHCAPVALEFSELRLDLDLGSGWRHIAYDERARGKSKKSADYSFEAVVRDLDGVLKARGVERPLLVGWSYGALLGVHWAARNPGRVAGVVGVDGPYPAGWTDEAGHERIRRLFHKFRWAFPMARLIGNAARMSAEQHADINIEALTRESR